MERLEFSGAVRLIYRSLGVKGLMTFQLAVLYKNIYHNPRCFYDKLLDVFQQITKTNNNNNDINVLYIQGDSKRQTQFRMSLFPEVYMVYE